MQKHNFPYQRVTIIFRNIFGIALPIFLSYMLLFFSYKYFIFAQNHQINSVKQIWLERAALFASSVRTNHMIKEEIVTKTNKLAKQIKEASQTNPDFSFSPKDLTPIIHSVFDPQIIAKDTWFFKYSNNSMTHIKIAGTSESKFKFMERTINALHKISDYEEQDNEYSVHNKSLVAMFGSKSSPPTIASSREGVLTPVTFSGKHSFLYWRIFKNASGEILGATIMIYPDTLILDEKISLQRTADRIFLESNNSFAAAFVAAKSTTINLKPILPTAFEAYPDYKNKLLKAFNEIEYKPYIKELTQINEKDQIFIQEIDDHLFVRSHIALDNCYDMILFSSKPLSMKEKSTTAFKIIFIAITFFWISFFIYNKAKTGRMGLPLVFSFRTFFFFGGTVPIIFMLFVGTRLINASHEAKVAELKNAGFRQLRHINSETNYLPYLFSDNMRNIITIPEVKKSLVSLDPQKRNNAFQNSLNFLKENGFNLTFMVLFRPGHNGELFLNKDDFDANVFGSYKILTAAVNLVNVGFMKGIFFNDPQKQQEKKISFEESSTTWIPLTEGSDDYFFEAFFLDSNELTVPTQIMEREREFFFATTLTNKGIPEAYIIFCLSATDITQNFLTEQLETANIKTDITYLGMKQETNSELTSFPRDKSNIFQSKVGQTAQYFLKSTQSAKRESYIADSNYIFISYPMPSYQGFTLGAIIPLFQANNEHSQKLLLLYSLSALMLIFIYILASTTTKNLLEPMLKLKTILKQINDGNIDLKITSDRSDEFGILFRALDSMLSGYKKREKIGKFVSSNLNKNLSRIMNSASEQKAQIISGCVLFSDIRSFTTISEAYPPDDVASMLNTHLDRMSEIIVKNNGFVQEFIGDAIVAFFQDDPSYDARQSSVNASIQMVKAHKTIVEQRVTEGKYAYSIGIGIAHGKLVSGIIQAQNRNIYSLTGAARTKAENLESASKKCSFSKIVLEQEFAQSLDNKIPVVPVKNTAYVEIIIND